jgi:phosphinothricin acetyltransferase
MEPRIDVRRAIEADLVGIDAIYNHYVRTSHVTFDLDERTADASRSWFEAHASLDHAVFVAARDGAVIGYAAAGPYRPRPGYASSVETSVYVRHDAVGNGVGRSLYTALFEAIDGLDLHRAVAGIALPNEPSVALHLAFGFRPVGRFTEAGRKFDRYWDVAWYERPVPVR